jgi:GDP-L-fucose synthase
MTDFYKGRDVIVLGGAGFVGGHLCRLLEDRGANVAIIDNLSRHVSQQRKRDSQQELFTVDIGNKNRFRNALSYYTPFAVFNLAASVAGVEYNQNHQNKMFIDNANLQTIPVQVCERLEIPHYLQVSSSCVYGEDANTPAIENNLGGEPTVANAGYSWAKRMGERVVQWSELPHAVIVRPSNIYGPGDYYDERAHVIPKLIKGYAKAKNEEVKIFASAPIREFIYVEDVVEGMLHALEFGEHKEVYNLGTNGETVVSIMQLHKTISALLGAKMPEISKPHFAQGDVARYSNCHKMNQLGWEFKMYLKDGLTATLKDYYDRR